MSHSTLKNLILIRSNDSIWLDIWLTSVLQNKGSWDGEETSNKRRKVTGDDESEDEEESHYTSTEEADFSFDED